MLVLDNLLLADINPATGIFFFSLAAVCFLLMRRSQRYFRAQRVRTSNVPASASPPATAAITSSKVDGWEVELHELARDLMGQLNTKIAVLERLIRDADRASQRLDSALADHRGTESPRALKREPIAKQNVKSVAVGKSGPQNSRPAKVYDLADRGYSASRIAEQLDSQLGEIELILSLRAREDR